MRYPGALEHAVKMREVIIDILEAKPKFSRVALSAEVRKTMDFTEISMQNAIRALMRDHLIIADTTLRRNYLYSIADGTPIVRRVPAQYLPKFRGEIYSPMGWIVHQLQGA